MKIAKVKVNKNRSQNGFETKFIYPTGYDTKVVSPFTYENKGNNTEYCLAYVPDSYVFSDDIVEVTKSEAEELIEDWVEKDKDFKKGLKDGSGKEITKKDILSKIKKRII